MRSGPSSAVVRPAAVAGTFYPRSPAALRREVAGLLDAAPAPGERRPKALVVPHAGYVYSGAVAAAAYARLRAPGPPVERVVLVGPAHHVPLPGLALPEAQRFETPLGEVPVDQEAARRALGFPQVVRAAAAHAVEHALEVQLPFLQELLGPFSIVPLAVGRAAPEEVAEVLEALWGGPETLVVISTDLSHYLPYDEGRELDRRTARQVLALDAAGLEWEQACGRTGLQAILLLARRRGLTVEQVDLRSSGDTGGDREAVVGYGAFALYPPAAAHPARAPGADRAAAAVGLARAALRSLFGGPEPARPEGQPWLGERRCCFVSLHRQGRLRGCVGALEPRGTLFEEIVRCARAAASADGRFAPVAADELPGLEVEVSVLSPLEPLPAGSDEELLRALRPGRDGLVLEAQGKSAVFIPAMWEQLPDPRDFLGRLRDKAGLPRHWVAGTRLQRFTADRYPEGGR